MIRKVLFLGAAGLLLGASAAFAFPPIDLTTQDATYTSGVDGTIWTQLSTDPTGTGVYNPFLRMHDGGNGVVEDGMNTDGNAQSTYDDVAGIWTHSITLGQLAAVTVGGQSYYQFTLDINEVNTADSRYLSLDELKIYTLAGSSSLTSVEAVVLAGGVLRYNLDGVSDQDVYMNYNLNTGSGGDDIRVMIPTSFFTGANANDQIYFYSKVGDTVGMEADMMADDGFEEWSALLGEAPPPPDNLPEPSAVMLLGTGLLGLAATRLRKK